MPFELVGFLLDLSFDFAIFLIVALSLNLEVGFAGIPNFGRVLTVAGGAFLVGVLPGRLALWLYNLHYDFISQNTIAVYEVNKRLLHDPVLALALLILCLALAAVIGAALGYIASRPAIRLREDYLAMTLLAMGEALVVIGVNYPPLVGGTLGVGIPDIYGALFGTGFSRYIYASLFTLIMAGLIYLYVDRLVKSPFGRLLKAMRDNELAIGAFGRDVVALRTKALVIGGAISGIAGALYALYSNTVNALDYDKVIWTFYPWLMIILGGLANNLGTLLGVFIFVLVKKIIVLYKYEIAAIVPFDPVWLEYMLFGVVLIAILILRPQGILPEKAEPVLGRKAIETIVTTLRQKAVHS